MLELVNLSKQINIDRAQLTNHDEEINRDEKQLNVMLNLALVNFLDSNKLSYFSPVKCRIIHPKGVLLIWSTAGIYWPFAGESQIDAGLYEKERPFVIAHELAHGMGWTNEGECNFIAYESCMQSRNALFIYSAQLQYWRTLIAEVAHQDTARIRELKSSLSFEVKEDLKKIAISQSSYPDVLPEIRNFIFNKYLESNNVHGGIKSYSEMILLVMNYKRKQAELEGINFK